MDLPIRRSCDEPVTTTPASADHRILLKRYGSVMTLASRTAHSRDLQNLSSDKQMTAIKNVSGTAFVVAEFRADENRAANPLYGDSIVELFLDDDTLQASRLVAASFPPVKDMVKVRTRYFDDTLEKQIVAGFRQVVILGSGLDTRAVRKPAPGVTYFEIDDAATLKLKQAFYEQHGIDANVKLIPGNYVD
jgi:O-methyltransferase involved in polyketide biosynthesis